jgi:hypothetical protein
VVTVTTRPGVQVTYVATRLVGSLARPHPVALVLLAGGNGLLQIGPDGSVKSLRQNFLLRSRANFLQSGAALVVAVDAPTDRPRGMLGDFRLGQAHAADLSAVIVHVRQSTKLAVWVVGTSSGTLSAVNVAASAKSSTAAGLVLASSQTDLVKGLCGKKVSDAKLAAITMPVLVAAHADDHCACSPPHKAAQLVKALRQSSKAEALVFDGGLPPKDDDPCQAMTPHGFYGVEKAVTTGIVDWIRPLLP